MRYSEGVEVRLGDRVRIWDVDEGMVVCSFDSDDYSEAFPKSVWADLKQGVMVRTDKGALVHIDISDSNRITRL